MLLAIRGPVVFIPHIIQVCPSDRCQECIGLYFYGPVPFHMRVFHSGKLPICICFPAMLCLISVVMGGGVSGRWWGGGPVLHFWWFSPGASLSGVALVN